MSSENPDLPIIDLDLRVGDRVERLDLTGEARWGTITGPDDHGDWLVLDNQGNTKSSEGPNLRLAVRVASPREH
jgi:hypothetical protein